MADIPIDAFHSRSAANNLARRLNKDVGAFKKRAGKKPRFVVVKGKSGNFRVVKRTGGR